jgi:hypothetical protein
MTYSYIEGNVPKLIVRYIFQNIPKFYCDKKNKETFTEIRSIALLNEMRILRPIDQ